MKMPDWSDESEWEGNPHEDDDMDIFLEEFDFALQQMATVYKRHRERKGDSWEEMAPYKLRRLFWYEMEEYDQASPGSLEEYHELIDMMNVGLMLLTKLSQEKVKEEDQNGQTLDSRTHTET